MKRIVVIALTFLLCFHYNFILAQNTGPVAPEASSFEPVDATDMVNLVTGDFSYVLPILNVPSPEGGFSMAISYHAGISMDQEASWVGLGWNITPGAINRNVNGFADDSKNGKIIGFTNIDPTYYSNYTRGVIIPLQLIGYPSIGLYISYGTQRSFGGSIGYSIGQAGGISVSMDTNGDFSVGGQLGMVNASIGSQGIGVGFGLSKAIGKNIGASASLGFNYNPSTGAYNVGLNFGLSAMAKGKNLANINSIGFSLGSGGFAMQYKGVGASSLMFGKLSNSDFSTDILENSQMDLIFINWSNFKVKYWAFKSETDQVSGTLYLGEGNNEDKWKVQQYNYKQDTYSIPVDYNAMSNTDALDANENLIFPAYDNFSVSVQGLSGSISPRIFKSGLLTGDGRIMTAGGDGREIFYNGTTGWGGSSDIYKTLLENFYFDNEPVSYASITDGIFSYPSDLSDPCWGNISFNGGILDSKNNKFFNSTTRRKGSSKPVEWFTNNDIEKDRQNSIRSLPLRGFIETSDISSRIDTSLFPKNGIGAFTITDSDGKKYYFSLPVYQFEEFTRSYPNPDQGDFLEKENFETYAYSWFLTAITGPDYVDQTGDGPSSDDYGYYVKFSYGKWTDGYIWQMPYLDLGKENPYHWGRKQVYYLNSIQTRTHTAYFVKNIREDAKGGDLYSIFKGHHTNLATHDTRFIYCSVENVWCPGSDINITYENDIITTSKHFSLMLDKIILVKNEEIIKKDLGNSFISGIPNSQKAGYIGGSIKLQRITKGKTPGCDQCALHDYNKVEDLAPSMSYNVYFQDSIIDINDVPENFEKEKALKVIKFNYDYSTCLGTPNSDSPEKGKLTLKAINIYGKNNTSSLPPYIFNYNIRGHNEFNLDNKDLWGFDKLNPDNWSLSKIINPVGSELNITYESDKYEKEAVYNGILKKQSVSNTTISLIRDFSPYMDDSMYPTPSFSNVYFPASNWFKVSGTSSGLISGKEYFLNSKINAHLHSYYYNVLGSTWNDNNSALNCTSLPIYNMVINGDNFSGDVYINNYWEAEYIMFRNEKEFKSGPKETAQFKWIASISTSGKYEITTFGQVTTLIDPYPEISDASLVYINPSETTQGGGLRVSKISVTDPSNNQTNSTQYSYSNGITTFAPKDFEFYVPYQSEIPPPMVYYGNVSVKTIGLNDIETGHTDYVFETPAICFGDFKKSAFTMGNASNSTYQFKVEDLQYIKNKPLTSGDNASSLTTRSAKITNNFASLGSLLNMSTYNSNNHLLGISVNNYKTPDQIDQGIVQETFQSYKGVKDWQNGNVFYPTSYYIVSSSKVNYPAMLASTTSSTNGNNTTVTFDKYDFFTGNVLEKTTTNSNGKTYKSVFVPAYEKYNDMGPSYDNPTKKNMLTQPAETYNYVDGKLINASVQTWNADWTYRMFDGTKYMDPATTDVNKVWRQHKSFTWKGEINDDGTYKNFDGKDFNWDNIDGNTSNGWLKSSEITRYNHFSAPIESKDIKNHYASSKMQDNDNYILATAVNANYNSFAFTGFESAQILQGAVDFGGEFMAHSTDYRQNNSYVSTVSSHTGDYYCMVTGSTGPTFKIGIGGQNGLLKGRKYLASVWMHKNSSDSARLVLQLKDSQGKILPAPAKRKADKDNKQFGDWILMTVIVDVPSDNTVEGGELSTFVSSNNLSSPMYIDDMRVQPVDASVTGYVYDYDGDLTAIIDNNNLASKFDYDNSGRLKSTYKETPHGFKKVSEHKQNYARSNYVVDFTTSNNIFAKNSLIDFYASDAGPYAKYKWDFGDGNYRGDFSEFQNVSHTYDGGINNNVTVKLTVTDADGKTNSMSKVFPVYWITVDFGLDGFSFPYSNGSGRTNILPIQLSASTTGPYSFELFNNSFSIGSISPSMVNSTLYNWDFGNKGFVGTDFFIRVTDNLTGVHFDSTKFAITQ